MNAPANVIQADRFVLLQHAKADVKARYRAQYDRLLADMQAEIDKLDREFWAEGR